MLGRCLGAAWVLLACCSRAAQRVTPTVRRNKSHARALHAYNNDCRAHGERERVICERLR
eukprot:558644-Lingulodinium_polyedra.AAC.1